MYYLPGMTLRNARLYLFIMNSDKRAIVFVDGNNWYLMKNFVFHGYSVFGSGSLRLSEGLGQLGGVL